MLGINGIRNTKPGVQCPEFHARYQNYHLGDISIANYWIKIAYCPRVLPIPFRTTLVNVVLYPASRCSDSIGNFQSHEYLYTTGCVYGWSHYGKSERNK